MQTNITVLDHLYGQPLSKPMYEIPHGTQKYQSYLCFTSCDLWLFVVLTHWGRVTHICVGYLTIIGPDNGLSPGRRQAIIWTSAGILLIGPLGTNFNEILIKI